MKSRITTLMMAIVFVITILNFSMIAPCATTEAESYITTAEIAAADADYYSEEHSDDKSQDPDLVINKTDNYANFLRDANDEFLAYSDVHFGESDENVYVKGIRVTYAYYNNLTPGSEATLRVWTPGDLVKEGATELTISVKGANLYDVNGSQYTVNNWEYLGTVKLPSYDENGDGKCDTSDFVTKDFMFATQRMVEPTSNVVITAGNGFFLRSFSFIKCSEDEARDAYGTIPATTADVFSTDLVGANHDTTGVSFKMEENGVFLFSSIATRYIGFNDVDFGTETWVDAVNLNYATASDSKEVYIYDVTDLTGDLSVAKGKLSVGGSEQTPLFTITPPSTGSKANYASYTGQTPMKKLSGKRDLIVTTNNDEIIFRSFGFEKEIFDIGHSKTDNNLVTSVKANRADVAEMVGEKMSFALITSLYQGQTLCNAKFKMVDVSDPDYDTVLDSLTMNLSDMQKGEYTVKSFVWKDMSSLTPLGTVVDDVINLQ